MQTFIRAIEVWRPAQGHTLLEFGAGLFGEARSFAATSRAMCFGRAEGLPGEAWDLGHPVLLKQFEGSHFRRTSAARLAGLTCAVALPYTVAGQLTAVLVLFGSDDAACTGAIELWRNDPRISSDMTLVDAYFGGLPPEFEALSRDTYLPRGTGLPGMAWQRDEAVIMGQLGASTRFLRGEVATDAGICRGLALPCVSSGTGSHVLTLLSGQDTPIARRMERWTLDRAREQLLLAGGWCEVQGEVLPQAAGVNLVQADAAVAEVLRTCAPALTEPAQTMTGPMGAAARACGASGCALLPVLVDDKVTEMVALYL